MDIRKEFSNLREFAGSADKYFLIKLDNNAIMAISDLPDSLSLPCNYLADAAGDGYYPPVDHIQGYNNASLWATNFTVGSFAYADAEVDGVTWIREEDPYISQDYVFRPSLRHSMAPNQPSVGIISIGQDADTIADDYGPVDGITIKAQAGTPIYFTEWDLTYKPDDNLVNCDTLGGSNEFGLPCTKGIEHCKARAEKAKEAEIGRIEHCNYHMENSEPHDHASSNTPSSCEGFDPDYAYSDCYNSCADGGPPGGPGGQPWLSNCADGCGHLRVDLTESCGCGGDDCKDGGLECGWELLLNALEE